jgi:hypothetical protein
MRDEFNPHFTDFELNSRTVLKHGTGLSDITFESWEVGNGIFKVLEKVFCVVPYSRYCSSPMQLSHSDRIKRSCKLIAISTFLLSLVACVPSKIPTATPPPAHGVNPLDSSVASNASKVNLHISESEIATQTPQSSVSEPSDKRRSVSDGGVQHESIDLTSPDAWKELPVIPEISLNVVQTYAIGISRGNNPRSFSKIGDCSTSNAWFLGPFDNGEPYYRLGEHTYLEPLIEHFKGSFARNNVTTRNGFSASSTLSPLWADPEVCESGETPLACEYRIHKPSIVFIMLGTNDRWHADNFEENMREIIEYTLDHRIIPIIATKADNFEGDESINRTLAQLATEYDLPLWNFWAAAQALPNQGLEEDGVHLTWGPTHFNDPEVMQLGWPTRNLTAMQSLYALWQAVQDSSVDETAVLR